MFTHCAITDSSLWYVIGLLVFEFLNLLIHEYCYQLFDIDLRGDLLYFILEESHVTHLTFFLMSHRDQLYIILCRKLAHETPDTRIILSSSF